MSRALNKLTDKMVKSLLDVGSYSDGGGLEIQVAAGGSRNWVFRFMLRGRRRQMGLGGYPTVSLATARQKVATARALVAAGIDPLDHREEAAKVLKVAEAKKRTFRQAAEAYITDQEPGWKNPRLAKLWRNTLTTYAFPVFGDWLVEDVDTAAVMDVLRPLWLGGEGTKPKSETASRVRMRVENILDWARVQGLRSGENPARWKGHLDHLLPAQSKVTRIQHHPAMSYSEVGAFMADLRGREALAARGLELLILTAARTSEVLEARWSEFDLDGATWTIPPERMKIDREHRVPLSTRAVDILRQLHGDRISDTWVLPGGKPDKPLSNMAFLVLLRRMNRTEITPHGFRSTFRDWAAEETSTPNHVVEMALAHSIRNAAEAAYRRGDLFEKRRRLMQDWADWCERPGP
ncbi:integrase [Paramagnetospirillum kuznetsovii]|uniref:Integrase n=1 Tax=Paramagnetospirillum kuznetsovii TaxID=2053833 RepID=A0A364P011_9PROT|nr:integrase arm-type DNA-binding domain-containing protein [Paramagnetospirillum kuznetsovii]RAU22679.1 integrase [Paramagnetospirillum kuznetsovii]